MKRHRFVAQGKRYVVRADERLTAFLETEKELREGPDRTTQGRNSDHERRGEIEETIAFDERSKRD